MASRRKRLFHVVVVMGTALGAACHASEAEPNASAGSATGAGGASPAGSTSATTSSSASVSSSGGTGGEGGSFMLPDGGADADADACVPGNCGCYPCIK